MLGWGRALIGPRKVKNNGSHVELNICLVVYIRFIIILKY